MSIINIATCYNLKSALEYQEGKNNDRVAVCSCNLEPFDFDEYAQMQIESGSHKVQGYTIIQSFSLDELENNKENAVLVNRLGCALIEAAYPNYPYKVVTHRDSKTGCLHNHCSVLNYELSTGKAITQNRRWLDLSHINDSVMEQNGMEVCDAKTRQADQKAYWDKKKNPDKYIWQDDLLSRINKALDGAVSVKDFATRLAVEGVTARLFGKNNQPLKHMSFSFVGNDGTTHRKRGERMPIPSTQKELSAVFSENATKLKTEVLTPIPKQEPIKQVQANKAAEVENAKQKAKKVEAEEQERRKAEQIRLYQQRERERLRQREEEKQRLLAESKEYNERDDFDDVPEEVYMREEQLEKRRQLRLKEIYAAETIEKADKLREGIQLDRSLEHAYNVSRQKQQANDGMSL